MVSNFFPWTAFRGYRLGWGGERSHHFPLCFAVFGLERSQHLSACGESFVAFASGARKSAGRMLRCRPMAMPIQYIDRTRYIRTVSDI